MFQSQIWEARITEAKLWIANGKDSESLSLDELSFGEQRIKYLEFMRDKEDGK